MENVIEHQIETDVAQAPPRPIGLSLGTSLLIFLALFLFAVFLYGGLRALGEAARLGWLAAAGQSLSAQVTAIDTMPAEGKDQPPVQTALRYRYQVPSGENRSFRMGTVRLSTPQPLDTTPLSALGQAATPEPAGIAHIGDRLPMRYIRWQGRDIILLWPPQAGGKILFLACCGSLITAVSVLMMRRLIVWRQHRLFLLRQGIATIGKIVHKHAKAEDAARYYLRYGYASENGSSAPEMCEHEEQVTAEQWKQMHVGQPVTVLYDPVHPENAGLYTLLRRF